MNKRWKLCRTDMKQSHSSAAGTAEAENLTQPTWCCVQCANCVSLCSLSVVHAKLSEFPHQHMLIENIYLKWQPTPERRRERETMCKLRADIMDLSDQCVDAKIMEVLLRPIYGLRQWGEVLPNGLRSSTSDKRGLFRRSRANGYGTDVNKKSSRKSQSRWWTAR